VSGTHPPRSRPGGPTTTYGTRGVRPAKRRHRRRWVGRVAAAVVAVVIVAAAGLTALIGLEQVGLAIKLDEHFTKHQILAMYLDVAYFGDGAYGITAAAHHYFGLPAGQLSWAQASLLAGLVQAPTAYDPDGHPHLALERRQHVLGRLVATGTLTPVQVRRIEAEPLHPVVPFNG
jgi:membrane carboxypeptidase/penicillin-binding protein PbpC